MGKIVLSCVDSLAFKTEVTDIDSSPQILMFWRFISFEITLLFLFHQGVSHFNLELQKLQGNVSFSLQKGVILDPCLGKGCIFANTTLIKLLTNAYTFPDRQILE